MVPGTPVPALTLTRSDQQRLDALLATRVGLAYRAETRRLRAELRRAKVIPSQDAPAGLVTMNSRLLFVDVALRLAREVTLVYPWRAGERSALSVFSPIGTALLGARVGEAFTWTFDDGASKVLQVVALIYQPEAAGDWHL